jgi:hypothetical protein
MSACTCKCVCVCGCKSVCMYECVWVCERVRTRKCVCVHVKNQVLYQSRPGAHSTVFIIWISLLYLTRQQIKNKKICREREKAKINWKDNERDWLEQWFSISAFTFGCFRQIHHRSLMVCPLSAFKTFNESHTRLSFPFPPQTMLHFTLFRNILFLYKYVFLSILYKVIKLT